MNVRNACYSLALFLSAAAIACTGTSNPSQPSSTGSGTGGGISSALSTASVTAPRPLSPATNAVVPNTSQPVTLVVQNAIVTRAGNTTYTFEVATDLGFGTKVQTKDGVAEGSGGQTSVRLDTLTPNATYYWHARAQGGGTTGVFSAPFSFKVGPAIIINAPAPIGPLTNTETSPRPALRVSNATRSGPAGAITYKFDVSTSSTFATIIATGTNAEGVNETGFIPSADLPLNVTLFWRATAIDAANGITSAPSAAQSFTARPLSQAEAVAQQLGVQLWPGATPPGSVGHATMGGPGFFGVGWGIQTLFYAPERATFQSPDLEMLRFFDLFDRGFDPDPAIAWMNANGYRTNAQWYPGPEKAVLGLHYVYIAARNKIVTNATWDIVLRVE